MLTEALERNRVSGDGGGLAATREYVQRSKLLLLKSGARVERLPKAEFAAAAAVANAG